jgi:hypothetical protein
MAKQTMAGNLMTAEFPVSKKKFSSQVAKAAMGLFERGTSTSASGLERESAFGTPRAACTACTSGG